MNTRMRSIRALHIQPHADAPKARGYAAHVWHMREVKGVLSASVRGGR